MSINVIRILSLGLCLAVLAPKALLADDSQTMGMNDQVHNVSLSQLAAMGQSRQQGERRRQPQANRQPQSRRGGLTFDYNHLTLWGGSEELDESGLEGDSWRFEGAIETGASSYLFLNWQTGDYEGLGERTLRELGLGIQEHQSDRTSFFLAVSYMQDRWEAEQLIREDANLLRGRYGMRGRPTDRIEIDGAVVYTRASGSTDFDSRWSLDLGLSVYVTESIAIRVAGLDLDGIQPSALVGLRFEFGGW